MNPLYSRIVPPHTLQQHRLLRYLWGLLTVSVSAQIGTAPLVAYYFGRLPVCFLLSNLVVIPLATVILYVALLCILSGWWAWLQQCLAGLLAVIVSLMNTLLQGIASLPGCSVGVNINSVQLWLLYVIIGCVYVLLMVTTPAVRRTG
jgi:competence protein ComEC